MVDTIEDDVVNRLSLSLYTLYYLHPYSVSQCTTRSVALSTKNKYKAFTI